jgi:hypothetical protein
VGRKEIKQPWRSMDESLTYIAQASPTGDDMSQLRLWSRCTAIQRILDIQQMMGISHFQACLHSYSAPLGKDYDPKQRPHLGHVILHVSFEPRISSVGVRCPAGTGISPTTNSSKPTLVGLCWRSVDPERLGN